MRLLAQMEWLIQRDSGLVKKLSREALIEEARLLLELAPKIVDLLVGGAG